MLRRTDLLGNLEFHQGPLEHARALPQEAGIAFSRYAGVEGSVSDAILEDRGRLNALSLADTCCWVSIISQNQWVVAIYSFSFSHLNEYVVFCRFMNFSHAAAELSMSQSNLSKHMKQLQSDIGIELISRDGKVKLTAAGQHFLTRARDMVESLESTVNECHEVESMQVRSLSIRIPTYDDESAMCLYSCLRKYHSRYPDAPVHFVKKQRMSPADLVSLKLVDAHIVLEYGDIERVQARYDELGLHAYFLCSEGLSVYCHHGHPIAHKDPLDFNDVRNVPIVETSQLYGPLMDVIREISRMHGFSPKFEIHAINSGTEMIFFETKEAIRLLPSSLAIDSRIKVSHDMVFRSFTEPISINAFLLMRKDCSNEPERYFRTILEEQCIHDRKLAIQE